MARATGPTTHLGASKSLHQWRSTVEAGLTGASFDDRLVATTPEGLRIEPLHPDQQVPATNPPARPGATWERHEELDLSSVQDLDRRLDSASRRGIDGLRLHGVSGENLTTLDKISRERGIGLHPTRGAAWDPNTVQVSTALAQCRGAGEPLQVALAMAGGLDALRSAESDGISISCSRLEFEFGLGTDLFLSIASLRALRLGWARLVAACGGSDSDQVARIHAVTSERYWTVRDPWINLLRGTTASFAAAVGGADSILTLPFDQVVGSSDESSRRLASNSQALLEEEAHLAAVLDPAAGSGYLEQLTSDIAIEAWGRLQVIESLGGLRTQAAQDRTEEWIEERRSVEEKLVATRRRPIVGVSEFPSLTPEPQESGAPQTKQEIRRIAHPFEELYRRCEALRVAGGLRLRAFMANLGTPAQFRPRAAFAANFLAVAGIESIENDGFKDVTSACEAFTSSTARLVVISSSDEVYLESAKELAVSLHAAGAILLLAGRPGENLDEWRSAGVADFIYSGCDALAILTRLLETLEVPA